MKLQKTMIQLLFLAVCIAHESEAQSSQTPAFKIASLRAFLYYNQSGSLSENVVDNPSFILWNIAIGEGSAGSPSNSTIVVVEISGKPGSYDPKRKIEFIAQAEGKVILKRTSEVGELNKEGKHYVPFLIYDTGWVPIKISATITGQTPSSSMKKEIGFASGE